MVSLIEASTQLAQTKQQLSSQEKTLIEQQKQLQSQRFPARTLRFQQEVIAKSPRTYAGKTERFKEVFQQQKQTALSQVVGKLGDIKSYRTETLIPYEKQIETNRKGKDTLKITEKALDTEPKVYRDKRLDKKRENVMDINLATEVHNQKFLKAFEAMEDKDKRDTLFWDKYVGVQLLGDESIERTKVDNNISNSQLENCPDRFTSLGKDTTVFDVLDKDVKKMVTASIKDADAMLFHIYRSAAVQDRKLTGTEQQMVNDIETGKINVLGQVLKEKYKYFTDKDFGNMFGRRPKKEKPNVIEGLGDPKSYNVSDDDIIIKAEGGVAVVYN